MLSTTTNSNNHFESEHISLPSPPQQKQQERTMTRDQHKYCCAIMRNLKKHRDAAPFLNPVDYVKLNVLDYPLIITHPMDLSLVDQKLNNSEYLSVDNFVADVRLVFSNCFKYNGPEAMISVLCQNVESAFEKGLRQMPPSTSPTSSSSSSSTNSPSIKKEPSPPLSQHNSPSQSEFYKPLSTVTTAEDMMTGGRPKREIHCPSKDYPETYTTQRKLSQINRSTMKYCLQTLKELKKNKYRHLAYPFLQPVDPVALNIPDYPTIVKHPMDLSTIETKLMNDDYKDPEAFEADVTLMFENCYLYNPSTLPIYSLAKEFEKVFRDKWVQRPPPPPAEIVSTKQETEATEEEEEEEEKVIKEQKTVTSKRPLPNKRYQQQQKKRALENNKKEVKGKTTTSSVIRREEEEDDDDSDDKIAELERHLANITQQIKSMKSAKKSPPTTTTTTATNKEKGRRGRTLGSKNKVNHDDDDDDDDELSFEQKKELSETINNLPSDRLSTVVSIIQSSMPHLGKNGQEEIVLDIDALDKNTLRRLNDFVNPRPIKKQRRVVTSSSSRYSAKETNRKIQQLEENLKKFNDYDSSSSQSGESDDNEGSSSDSSSSDSD
ncbi:MAG: Bromodomain-containing protein [Benjaminiella poitrasii]|nr:MAG: Bromodomain-containing protein [Benjaminiella poitrasii]